MINADSDKKVNRRVRMTRQLLKDSLIELLKSQSIHQISIRELCENADINRSTFYKHYGSQYDVLKDIENDVLEKIDSELSQVCDTNTDRLENVFIYSYNNLELCRMLFNSNIDPDFPKKVIYLPSIRSSLDQFLPDASQNEKDYMYDCIVYGGFNIVSQWLNKENRETPSEMAAMTFRIFRRFLKFSEDTPNL